MKKWHSIILFIFLLIISPLAQAQEGRIIIRDEEIEQLMRAYSTPIFEVAGLAPNNVDIHIIQDSRLNAFVSGGMNIFFHTGLIVESNDPLMLIGVIAHEAGHIAGGHLIRRRQELEKTLMQTTISYVLGGVSLAAGAPGIGAALITGGQHVAERSFLRHSRTHEQSADQAALTYLEKTGYSASGLLDLLKILSNQETLFYDDVNPYLLTHPLSQTRVDHIQNYLRNSPLAMQPAPEYLRIGQERIVAKLKGFLDEPESTLRNYPVTDNSVPARYARAIAYHKMPNLEKALQEMDALIAESPNDPYFLELKGQILFEQGKINQSIPYYEKAAEILPRSTLIQLGLAMSRLATEDNRYLNDVIAGLEKAVLFDKRNVRAWRQLGIAYGKNNQLGKSYLALAERSALLNEKEDAIRFAKLAEQHLSPDDPGTLRAKDIRRFVKNKDDG